MRQSKRTYRPHAAVALGAIVLATGVFASGMSSPTKDAFASVARAIVPSTISFTRSEDIVSESPRSAVAHVPTPKPLKAVYMSQCVAGTPSFRQEIKRLIETTELNAVVIDIKDYSGGIGFPVRDPDLQPYVSSTCGADDMEAFVRELHEKDIYVIGRITVFQDPLYVKAHPEFAVKKKSDRSVVWKDHKGLAFIDVGAKPFWDHIVTLSNESYSIGFDELNFDYIRFPSDGDMKDIAYTWSEGKTKQEALEAFFSYLHESLSPTGVVMSADLFGMTATNEDDLNIGQVLERTLPYFDYVAPMVYPSHYPSGFNGYLKVNEHPYDIVHFSMGRAVARAQATTTRVASFFHERIGTSTPALYAKPAHDRYKLRPWLQDFDYPVPYTPAMVRAQIKATEDAGLDSYMFWDPANKYSSLRQILLSL